MYCPSCGTKAFEAAKFCHFCGSSLPTGMAEASAPAPQPKVIEQASPAAGRRFITVMFVDMAGSTLLAERLDPEEFASLLIAYREMVGAVIARFGGYISRYVGDGILVCFGYPRARGRDAEAAVSAALEITRLMGGVSECAAIGIEELVALRIGIETGLVVAGRLRGNPVELDALVGTAPNTAARLQSLAPRDGVVIGETTQALVTHSFVTEPIPIPPAVSGLTAAWRVVAPRGRHESVTQNQCALIGREAEFGVLRAAFALAASGQGQVVLICGEPGIGKSRLLRELGDGLSPHAQTILELFCAPQSATSAFAPVIDALRERLGTPPDADGPTLAAAATHIVGPTAGTTEAARTVLVATLRGEESAPGIAPTEWRQTLFRTLHNWLLSLAVDQPVLLVAEDLHWADPSTLELLLSVGEAVASAPILLAATYRNDFALSWPDRAHFSRILLRRLPVAMAEVMLSELIGAGGAATEGTRRAIIERAEGVPLFLEEFVRFAAESTVPRSLQQLLAARLDGLDDARSLAQIAAVIGREAPRDVLVALAGLPEPTLDAQLRQLIHAYILVQQGVHPFELFKFRHALLQQAAYDRLLQTERRTLHQAAARILARLRPELALTRPEVLAHHYAAGDEADEAVPLFIRAARRDLATNAFGEAEAHSRAALALIPRFRQDQRDKAEATLNLLLGQALIAIRGYGSDSVRQAFDAAHTAAAKLNNPDEAIQAIAGQLSYYQVRGPLSKARTLATSLVAITSDNERPAHAADARRRLGWCLLCVGELEEARTELDAGVALARGLPAIALSLVADQHPIAVGLANLAWAEIALGSESVAIEHALAAEVAARTCSSAVARCYALQFAAFALQDAGLADHGLALSEQVLALADTKGVTYWTSMAQVGLGSDALRRGHVEEGLCLIKRGVDAYSETGAVLLRPYLLGRLAEALAGAGRKQDGLEIAREGIEVANLIGAGLFVPRLDNLFFKLR